MAAIAVSADGNQIFLALENGSGQPLIAMCERDDLATFIAVYNPAAGSAGNVLASSDPDVMFFYGYFGSGYRVLKYVISTDTVSNISPSGVATYIVNSLAVNPADANELWATINTDQDLRHTTDGGTAWETLNAGLGLNPTALLVVPGGEGEPPVIYIAGNDGVTTVLLYSPNNGISFNDVSGVSLAGTANIIGLEYAAES
jgi:hypothetical protein